MSDEKATTDRLDLINTRVGALVALLKELSPLDGAGSYVTVFELLLAAEGELRELRQRRLSGVWP